MEELRSQKLSLAESSFLHFTHWASLSSSLDLCIITVPILVLGRALSGTKLVLYNVLLIINALASQSPGFLVVTDPS